MHCTHLHQARQQVCAVACKTITSSRAILEASQQHLQQATLQHQLLNRSTHRHRALHPLLLAWSLLPLPLLLLLPLLLRGAGAGVVLCLRLLLFSLLLLLLLALLAPLLELLLQLLALLACQDLHAVGQAAGTGCTQSGAQLGAVQCLHHGSQQSLGQQDRAD